MRARSALLAALLSVSVATAAAADDRDARALIERLRAPCCWNQTLDVHASGIADELRAEIHRRVAAGEPVDKIEADLVRRYGERIRAIPREGFLTPLGVFGMMAAALGLVFTITVGVRMSRGAKAAEAAASPATPAAASPAVASAGPAGAPADSEEARRLRAELEALD